MANKQTESLTRNQSLVVEALRSSDGPMSAYTILDKLRDKGFRAPLQVYRAVEKLQEMGLIHRLESLNAFVACRHPACEGHETAIFMICDSCDTVNEVADETIAGQLGAISSQHGFSPLSSTVELKGKCGNCNKQ